MYDLIIIGGGPGGYHLAAKAGKAKLKVAIVEKEKFGGVCVNVGCIPSKAFLHVEKVVSEANESMDIGVVGEKLSIDQKKVVEYKDKKVAFLSQGAEAQVKGAKAKIFKGEGKILPSETKGEFKVQVNGKEVITGSRLVVATGSSAIIPPIEGMRELYETGSVITSTEALSLLEIPEELVVVGAGVIGLELGSYFASAGSKVTVIEFAGKIASATDSEITELFQAELERKGMKFILNSKVTKVTENEVFYEDASGKTGSVSHNKVMVSVGRKANIENIGIENLNVYTERQGIVTDDKLRTNVPNVWAIGDVNGKLMLAHTAYKEGEIVLENILGMDTHINYDHIPLVIYGNPEISEIGITEDRAKKEGFDYSVKKISMLYSGRFVIENAKYNGILKVIINNKTNEIIGMSMFGSYAAELILAGSLLVGKRFSIEQVREVVFAHPTVGEIIKDVLFS